jgi:hypothetical protein
MNNPHRLALPALGVLLALGLSVRGDTPATPPAPPGAAPPPVIEVRGLRLAGPEYPAGREILRPFGWTPGLAVALLVTRPAGPLIALDEEDSRVTRFTDDKGTNLLAGERRSFSSGFRAATMAKDGSAAMLELNAPGLPAKGFKELAVQGVLVFRTATQQRTVQQVVALRPGTPITVLPFPLTVAEVSKISGGNMQQLIGLEGGRQIFDIISIKFINAAGIEVEASETGWSSNVASGRQTVRKFYNLAQKSDTLLFRITLWADAHDVPTPVDFKFGLGM